MWPFSTGTFGPSLVPGEWDLFRLLVLNGPSLPHPYLMREYILKSGSFMENIYVTRNVTYEFVWTWSPNSDEHPVGWRCALPWDDSGLDFPWRVFFEANRRSQTQIHEEHCPDESTDASRQEETILVCCVFSNYWPLWVRPVELGRFTQHVKQKSCPAQNEDKKILEKSPNNKWNHIRARSSSTKSVIARPQKPGIICWR